MATMRRDVGFSRYPLAPYFERDQPARRMTTRREALYTARSLSIDTPSAILTAMEPSRESGCRAKVRPEPPTRTLAPAPRPRPMSPDAPIYSPASAPAGAPLGGREDGPGQHAAGGDTYVEADGIDRSLVSLRRARAGRRIVTLHRLMASDDESDARIELAGSERRLGSIRQVTERVMDPVLGHPPAPRAPRELMSRATYNVSR